MWKVFLWHVAGLLVSILLLPLFLPSGTQSDDLELPKIKAFNWGSFSGSTPKNRHSSTEGCRFFAVRPVSARSIG
jgi:hypothetical protein